MMLHGTSSTFASLTRPAPPWPSIGIHWKSTPIGLNIILPGVSAGLTIGHVIRQGHALFDIGVNLKPAGTSTDSRSYGFANKVKSAVGCLPIGRTVGRGDFPRDGEISTTQDTSLRRTSYDLSSISFESWLRDWTIRKDRIQKQLVDQIQIISRS